MEEEQHGERGAAAEEEGGAVVAEDDGVVGDADSRIMMEPRKDSKPGMSCEDIEFVCYWAHVPSSVDVSPLCILSVDSHPDG